MRTIAWIDDEYDIIEPFVSPLRPPRGDFSIRSYRTMKDVLDDLDTIRGCHLILLDLVIPEGRIGPPEDGYVGLTLLQYLGEHGVHTHRVIVLTLTTNADIHRRCQELGVARVITKPILPSELKRLVEEVLRETESAAGSGA